MTTRNEAAERLRESFEPHEALWVKDMLDKALATERHNTVERIRIALQPRKDRIGGDPAYNLSELAAILDEIGGAR